VHTCGVMEYMPVCVGLADKVYPVLKILELSIVCAIACSKYFVLCCIPHPSLSVSQKWCKRVGVYVNISYFILTIVSVIHFRWAAWLVI